MPIKQRKAFLTGVNAYPNAPLQGCVNDVLDVANALVRYGWQESDIHLLLDARVTKDNWIERMDWLIDTSPNDTILYWGSGHGAQIATRNPQQELDGLDEISCLVNFNWDDISGTAIRDKEFAEYIAKIPAGVNAIIGSDTCNSGGLMRSMLGNHNPIIRPRHFPEPPDIAWRNEAARRMGFAPRGLLSLIMSFWELLFGAKSNSITPDLENTTDAPIAYISGCKSNQTSADTTIGGHPCGAMTHYFWSEIVNSLDKPFQDVVAAARNELSRQHYSQEPQAEGSKINQTVRLLLGLG